MAATELPLATLVQPLKTNEGQRDGPGLSLPPTGGDGLGAPTMLVLARWRPSRRRRLITLHVSFLRPTALCHGDMEI